MTHNERMDDLTIRTLRTTDLEDVVRIDSETFGKVRRDYFRLKLERALLESSVRVSLAAEHDKRLIGFLMGSVYYGDYGQPEPVAMIEAVGIQPSFARRGVGSELWRQFLLNVKGMRVDKVHTQVDWDQQELLGFFHKLGFRPGGRLVLERPIDPTANEDPENDDASNTPLQR